MFHRTVSLLALGLLVSAAAASILGTNDDVDVGGDWIWPRDSRIVWNGIHAQFPTQNFVLKELDWLTGRFVVQASANFADQLDDRDNWRVTATATTVTDAETNDADVRTSGSSKEWTSRQGTVVRRLADDPTMYLMIPNPNRYGR